MKEIFVEKRSPNGLRSCHNLQLPRVHTTCNGLETISFRGCRLWQALPNDIKRSEIVINNKKGKIEAMLFGTAKRRSMIEGLNIFFGDKRINATDSYK